ncbi:ArdC family protein [Kozakia baliensis]|uniref:ArdC family protein n=1 Tax=Kozakia baliensis TaxID=153496 RepID=UPI000879ADB9|nr:zincin-like metallopeptidase domain-containing protein [Kozakia baliensis]AOX21524.1 antirepressor [Kozakia baliensis]
MSRSQHADLYQDVTDRIVADLESGILPWVQPWSNTACGPSLPHNAATQRNYSGINLLLLWGTVHTQGFTSQRWLTFRQALAVGGNVRKGEKGTTVFYADRFVPKSEAGSDDARAIPFLKRFTVFNVDQCDNLPDEMTARIAPPAEAEIIPAADRLIRATGATIRVGGNKAFYMPALDLIQVPPQKAYDEPVNWYRTVLHELGHWSGSEKRLDRKLSNRFGTYDYMAEELIAEVTSAFLLAKIGITPTVRHADYCGNWITMLKADKRAIFTAARLASAAADYILAFDKDEAREVEADTEGLAEPELA